MADVQIAVIDTIENEVNVAVPGVQGPIGSVAIAQDGTATEPGIRFESDTNTGIYRPGADQLAVSTGGTGRLFVDSFGRILIGTASALNVSGSAGFEGLQIQSLGVSLSRFASTGNGPYFNFARSGSNTVGTNSIIPANSTIGAFSFNGADGSIFAEAAEIRIACDGTPAAGSMPGAISFRTTPSGSTTATERMRLDSSGRLGLGTSSPSSALSIDGASNLGALGSGAPAITLKNTDTTNFNAAQIVNRDSGGNIAGGISFRNGSHGASGNSDIIFHTRNAGTVREPLAISSSGTTTLNAAASTAPFIAQINSSEVARIDSSGRLGIGTSSPAYKIDVAGQGRFDHTAVDAVIFARGGTLVGDIGGSSGGGTFSIRSQATVPLAFSIAASEAARIDSSGRLLVGTSTSLGVAAPQGGQLQVADTTVGVGSITTFANNTNGGFLMFGKSRGATVGSYTVVQNNDQLGTIRFGGSDGTDLESYGASIEAYVNGTPGANDMPGRLVFSTTADGAASPTERLSITSAGVLLLADAGDITVGTTTGTKIGTATTQKLGFYNATPVVQPTAVADATDAATVITQLNALLTRMRNLGLIAT
jgi:predicted aconitase with swiveling domain